MGRSDRLAQLTDLVRTEAVQTAYLDSDREREFELPEAESPAERVNWIHDEVVVGKTAWQINTALKRALADDLTPDCLIRIGAEVWTPTTYGDRKLLSEDNWWEFMTPLIEAQGSVAVRALFNPSNARITAFRAIVERAGLPVEAAEQTLYEYKRTPWIAKAIPIDKAANYAATAPEGEPIQRLRRGQTNG